MEITSSYQAEILTNADMKNTVQIYRRALAFFIDVCNKEWTNISPIDTQQKRQRYIERLIIQQNPTQIPNTLLTSKGLNTTNFHLILEEQLSMTQLEQ